MKYLLDTNVLVSAALFPTGVTGRAYDLALTEAVDVVVCDYSLTELRSVFTARFPDRVAALEAFIAGIEPGIKIVPTPEAVATDIDVESVRDPKDWPILRAALAAGVDVIVTGDKDILDAGLPHPAVMTPAQFFAALLFV